MTTKSGEEVTARPPLSSPLRVATRPLSFFFCFNLFIYFFLQGSIFVWVSQKKYVSVLYMIHFSNVNPHQNTLLKNSPHIYVTLRYFFSNYKHKTLLKIKGNALRKKLNKLNRIQTCENHI
jgi:hypothetical protein